MPGYGDEGTILSLSFPMQTSASSGGLMRLSGRPGGSLCYAPSAHLHFGPEGYVAVCCMSTFRRLGHVDGVALLELWRGPAIAEIRTALAGGQFPTGCEACAWHLEQGSLADHPALVYDALASGANDLWPIDLQFAFSNLCNLACLQCSPEFSSVIRKSKGLPPLQSPYGDRFFSELQPFLEHAQSISLLGGEPFLHRESFRLTDALIGTRLRTHVHVTTNGTVYTKQVERMLEQLPVSLSVSLDGVSKATIERVRVGARAEVVLTNLRRFAAYHAAHAATQSLTLNFCLMPENWSELPEFFLLAQELGADVWVTPVTHPTDHSLFSLPTEAIREIAGAWGLQRDRVLHAATVSQRRVWESLENLINTRARDGIASGVWSPKPIARARELLAKEDWTGAIREASHTPRDDKDYFYTLLQLAHAHRRLGQLEDCEACLNEALALPMRNPSVFIERAWLRWEQGRDAEGIEAARSALDPKLDDGNDRVRHVSDALQVLVNLTARSRQIPDVLDAIERWTSLKTEDGDAWFQCGCTLADLGLRPEALARLDEALRRLPPGDRFDRASILAARLRAAGGGPE